MNEFLQQKEIIKYRIYFKLAWGVFILLLFIWNLRNEYSEMYNHALIEAKTNVQKDLVYRMWASKHGGVYVPVTDQTPPNPYLSHVPERDIVTPSGKKLTLINPAYMTRQVYELSKELYGVNAHITSLKLRRLANKPDPWEAKALKQFEVGDSMVFEKSKIN